MSKVEIEFIKWYLDKYKMLPEENAGGDVLLMKAAFVYAYDLGGKHAVPSAS